MKKPEELKKLINTTSTAVESKEGKESLPESNGDQDSFTKT
jgi:hypothetical protein